ncbi:MAG: dicarboxylate/amino acid:cation symporter [Simkaniaceae bacterium]|nr:dicarboxylate/amino acid:cation symporter [Candidatus Sacchlamyda saccharinae]
MSKRKMKKPWSILIALALAVFVGAIIDKETRIWGISPYHVFDVVGTLFINALTLVVVPLVSSSIIIGVARIASESQFGRLGLRTFFYFFLTNFVGILIGFSIVSLFSPGSGISISNVLASDSIQTANTGLFSDLILEIIPSNILAAFAKGNMLGLIFFSLLFGYAITQIQKKYLQTHMQMWKGVFEAMIRITHAIMVLLPVGVFCLAAKIFAEAGLETLKPLGNFVWVTLLGFALFAFGFIPLLLSAVGKVSIRNYFKAISPAIVTAFSTGSSSATLPISLECMEVRAGVSNRICSLVIPLGTSLNLAGTALYNTMAVLFISQVNGIDLTPLNQITLVIAALLVSFGVASVPGGGLVAALTLLRILGLPAEGIGLVLATDRILDMFRSTVNVCSYTTCSVLVAKSDGEETVLANKEALLR